MSPDTSRALAVMGGVIGFCTLWGVGALFFHADVKRSRGTLYEAGAASAAAASVIDGSTQDGPSQAEREARAAATWPDDQKAIASNLDDAKKDRARQDWAGAEASLDLAWDALKGYQGTPIQVTVEWSSLKARMDAEEDLVWPHYQKAKAQQAEADAIELRKNYASEFDDALLAKHLNPDRVVTTGPKATTLHVEGWFCSRQWIFDESQDASALVGMGFTRLECASAVGSWWQNFQ